MKLFDSHSHIHDKKFSEDRLEMLDRAREVGVQRILTLGDTLKASRDAIALAEQHDMVLAAAGIHPSNANCWDETTEVELEALLAHPRVVVLGEIGLDYYWEKDEATVAKQKEVFRAQLRMAKRLGYPVSIHSRESNSDVMDMLEEEGGRDIGGVLHCFIATAEEMQRGIDLGFAIGVGGIATYKNTNDLRTAIKTVGTEHLLIETDAPYLPPQPKRGRRNEPSYVAMTCELMAETLGLSADQLATLSWDNTIRHFRLTPEGNPRQRD